MINARIILASASPRRRQILEQAGIECEIIESGADEDIDGSAFDVVRELARRKAAAVLEKIHGKKISADNDEFIIIAADTLVELDGEVLSKPVDGVDAFAMLRKLSSERHTVYTGVAIFTSGGLASDLDSVGRVGEVVFVDAADVFFRELSDDEIRDYIATGEPMDKAGAYGIQERGATLVRRIEGDFYTVMGLPISRVWEELQKIK